MPIIPDMLARIINAADEIVNWPQTSGGGDATKKTPLMNPNVLVPGYLFYATGAFDDVTNGKRGTGTFMEITQDGAGQDTMEGQFIEHVYVHGGSFGVHNEAAGDWVEMVAYAPASSPTDRTSEQDGNADKVGVLGVTSVSGTFQAGEVVSGGTSGHAGGVVAPPASNQMKVANATGSFTQGETVTGATSGATATVAAVISINMIVPNGTSSGYWNVDGSTLVAGELNENLAPVPNDDDTGYWNWDPEASPSITPAAGDGAFDLYDQNIPLVRQANRLGALLHEKDCCPESLKGKKFLPHWKILFRVNRATTGVLTTQFILKTSRKSTVNLDDPLS